jgi:hypothetical protein
MALIQYAREKIYSFLKKELEENIEKGPFVKAVENNFIIAGNYWSELRATVAEYDFTNEEQEILFFKTIKPLFIAELEYYSLVYHSLLFCPFDRSNQKKFWEREAKRPEDFKEQYRDFYLYHTSGRTDRDQQYYLRGNAKDASEMEFDSYDREPNSRTTHDNLIAKLWALERYAKYACSKLKELDKLI